MKHCTLAALLMLAAGLAWADDVVTYEAFGAIGDGRTDDMQAIVKAHAAANARGVPVRAADGRTYYLGKGAATAEIRTDVDFGTARFVIDDVNCEKRTASVFRVAPSARSFAVSDVATLSRGQTNLGVRLPGPCLLHAMNRNVRQYIRFGANQNNGSPQQEVFLADADGAIDPRAPIVWDFDRITSLTAYPVDGRTLVIRGGVFTTIANQCESKYDYHARNILVERSNVRIEGLRHEVTGELDHGAPYGGFVSVSRCANVLVTNCVFTAHRMYATIGSAGVKVNMGSYDITANNAVNVSYVHCRQTTDILDGRYWGLFGSNYCKNLLYDDCVFSRFDAHMGVANATVRNSVMGHMGMNAIGFGTFLVENTKVHGRSLFNLRSDYGSTWEGEFVVRNCTLVPRNGRKAPGTVVCGSNSGQHDFGYVCHMPRRIVVDGLFIDDTEHPDAYDGPFIFGQFNAKNTSADYVEKFPFHVTEEVELRNVRTASGKELRTSPNAWMFRDVRIVRK